MLSFTPLRLRPLKGAGAVGQISLNMALGGDCLRRVLRGQRCFSWVPHYRAARKRYGIVLSFTALAFKVQ